MVILNILNLLKEKLKNILFLFTEFEDFKETNFFAIFKK